MAAHEEIRCRLQRKLTKLVGEEEAAALMASLPPIVWTELATKADLAALERNLRTELRGGLSELRGELHSQIGSVRSEMTLAIRGQTIALLTSMVVLVVAVAGLVLAFA